MAGFIIIIAVVIICVLLFGKADSKRAILNEVGLDLSESSYKNKKQNEFSKYCLKAMRVAIDEYDVKGQNESEFVSELEKMLFESTLGPYRYERAYGYDLDGLPESEQVPNYDLKVKDHYARFASRVVGRRRKALEKPDVPVLVQGCDYSNKQDLKKYIIKLWDKYQYPWPDDWMQEDRS